MVMVLVSKWILVRFDVMHRVLDELIAITNHETQSMTHIGTGLDEIQDLTDHLMDTLGLLERVKQKNGVICDPSLTQSQTIYGGIAVLKNVHILHSLYITAMFYTKMKPHCPIDVLHVLDYVDQTSTSHDWYVTFITVTLGVGPFLDKGIEWLQAARDTIM
jgi:hypothetical protein